MLFSPKPPVSQHWQASFTSLLTSPGAQLQHIESSVLKDKKPYSAHNFGLLSLLLFIRIMQSLGCSRKYENDHHPYRTLSNMLKDF